jgi:DNA primase
MTTAEVDSFRLGYAPAERHALKEHLAAKGFALDDMIAAGMLVAGDDIPVAYDRFRGRLIFPITDMQGRVIGFGGRTLEAGQQPKYLNSPNTPFFRKGSVLFNAAAARGAAHQRGAVIAAEGYLDVIALARAGFPNAVAPLGTALTAEQIGLLWRLAPEPVLCFDGDAAGQKAAHRAVETALPLLQPGRSLAFAFLPDGLDPDDMLRECGGHALAAALAEARPLVHVLWAKEFTAGTWDTPERRAQLETRLFALINGIADRTVRTHYGQAIRRRLGEAFAPRRAPRAAPAMRTAPFPSSHGMRQPYQRQRRGASCPIPVSPPQPLPASAMPTPEALLLATVLQHPWLLDSEVEAFAAIAFETPGLAGLRDRIVAIAAERGEIDRDELRHALEAADAAVASAPKPAVRMCSPNGGTGWRCTSEAAR